MYSVSLFLVVIASLIISALNNVEPKESAEWKLPKILVASLIRNKAHTLPMFLTYLQEQDYPKNRIALWLATDHNEDNSREILETWLVGARDIYHQVYYQSEDVEMLRFDEENSTHWSESRFLDVIRLKEAALEFGRNSWADYVFFIDADVFLTFPTTLSDLVDANLPIVAPMLIAADEGLKFTYSNFWCGMFANFSYQHTEDYYGIKLRQNRGKFVVPLVHSAVLIDLRRSSSDLLTFNKTKLNSLHPDKFYDGPLIDIITFAMSANFSGTQMILSNAKHNGFVMNPQELDEMTMIFNTKTLIIIEHEKIHIQKDLKKFVGYPEKSKLTLSEIYTINLKRRPERKRMMEALFKEVGVDASFVEAIDGKELTEENLVGKGIRFLPNYEDWYDGRFLTKGEVGCFLSHYKVWEKMVAAEQQVVLILEDDVRFEYDFGNKVMLAMEEARTFFVDWDLIYLGRSAMDKNEEKFLPNSLRFKAVGHSYGTFAYVLSLKGAKKLLAAKPLEKLFPIDHFFSIMFDQHPNQKWKEQFEHRNLIALSVEPHLVRPARHWEDEDHTSDISLGHSRVIKKELFINSRVNDEEL